MVSKALWTKRAILIGICFAFIRNIVLFGHLGERLPDDNIDNEPDLSLPEPPDFGRWKEMEASPFHFSACLLVKDDNRRLPEWLAYHWTVLPLRRLILAVDPYSLTSPQKILRQFEAIGLNTTLWTDEDYLFAGNLSIQRPVYGQHNSYGEPLVDQDKWKAHLWRQQVFLTRCTQQLKKENQTWTILIDSDEYLSFNWYRPNVEGPPQYCIDKARINRRRLNRTALHQCQNHYQQQLVRGDILRDRLPPLQNATVAEFIQNHMATIKDPWFLRFCIVVPRVGFGGKEVLLPPIQMPPGFDTSSLQTFRFRQHEALQNSVPGKSIVDIRRYDPATLPLIGNPHRVLGNLCESGPIPRYTQTLFRVNHYTGLLDDFMRPGDTHRTEEQYTKRNKFESGGQTSDMTGWLGPFCQQVGLARSVYLTTTLRKEAVIEYSQILKNAQTDDAAAPTRYPFMPSGKYLKDFREKEAARLRQVAEDEAKLRASQNATHTKKQQLKTR